MGARLALIRRLPPGIVARRAFGLIERHASAVLRRGRDRRDPTYGRAAPEGPLLPLFETLPTAPLDAAAKWIIPAAELYRRHFFDLLGSGWYEIAHGMECPGMGDHRYPPGPAIVADRAGNWLAERINAANLPVSQRIWRLTDPDYRPIDWQLDIKSGYRWRESDWSEDIPIGQLPGVDIKLPWELARMQHLPVFAWAYALAKGGRHAGLKSERWYLAAFRNQVLDFAAANPPRYGVNWRCAMDVAIRAANWVVAHDLFRAFGARFDAPFTAILKTSLVDHARHIIGHLEYYPEGRSNHYLADVAGLLVIARALPRSPETDAWLAFAVQELLAESEAQFGADGAGFEGSTCYHRLAAEMVAFGTAIILGLPPEKRAALDAAAPAALRTRPARPLAATRPVLGAGHFARLAQMADFTRLVTKPNGRVAQIGDNDSGRFLKLHPILVPRSVAEARLYYANLDNYRGLAEDAIFLDEEGLDHRPLVATIGALLNRDDLLEFAGAHWLDVAVVRAIIPRQGGALETSLARPSSVRRQRAPEATPSAAKSPHLRTTEIVAGGEDLRRGLALAAFPDFGLWIFRSQRLFLAIRCGPIGQRGRGAHAHNDQLALELAIDGEDWIADPGSYLYTPDRAMRNAYRSVQAHCAPRWGTREPGRLDLGDFWLGDEAQAHCLAFDEAGFIGEHRGYDVVLRRQIILGETTITILDSGLPVAPGEEKIRCVGRSSTIARLASPVPFSPGYGKRHRPPALLRQ
jgi:hypothetical protein